MRPDRGGAAEGAGVVSMVMVQNEVGVVQPIAAIAAAVEAQTLELTVSMLAIAVLAVHVPLSLFPRKTTRLLALPLPWIS